MAFTIFTRKAARLAVGCIASWGGMTFVGCKPSTAPTPAAPQKYVSSTPLRDMKAAVRGQVWHEAWMLADQVLEKYPEDAEAISMVAMVAYEMKHLDRSAELLVRACRIESFKNESRVQQAMIALLQVGRLHDSMDFLEEALAEQPSQLATRRLLYDLCIGTEDRPRAIPHGRFLIQKRKFDLEFLLALGNTQYRNLETEPLETMVFRNPGDVRPLVGQARISFDQSQLDETISQAQKIIAKHPDYQPAQLLLGRALVKADRLLETQQWVASQESSIRVHADYWLTLGDWARAKSDSEAAVRCYWEATQREPDRAEPWSKLSSSLQTIQNETIGDHPKLQESVDQRAALLSELNQFISRFERTGKISRAISLDIIKCLEQLGRLWEAEAWASIALTLPEDDSVPIDALRQAIVSKLTRETPWQTASGFPELQSDLGHLKLPSIAIERGNENTANLNSLQKEKSPIVRRKGELRLEDEATARGLRYLASTGDDLDKPGIMLFKTLGCGGGAIDYDLDGWSDLYLVTAGGEPPNRDSWPNALMRNQDGNFASVTEAAGTGDTGFGQGVAVGDLNEDGFADLLVLNYGPNSLFLNNGDGTFSDRSANIRAAFGPDEDTAWSTSGAIADLDNDGISDMVILNYCAGLGPIHDPCPMAGSSVVRSCSPMKFPALADQFLQQRPDGSFKNRTQDWNAVPDVLGRGLGIVIGNLDGVVGNETFVANDMTNNHYWAPSKDAASFQLHESAMPRGLAADDRMSAQGSMGIACSDLDDDGDIDCYVTNFDKEYNTFHEQTQNAVWRDRTAQLNLVEPTLPWVGFGTQAIDLDLDGVLEIVVSNGHVDLFSRGDEKVQYAQPMQIFERVSDSTFQPIESLFNGNYMRANHVGRALWTLDVNCDGRTDCVVTHQTEPVSLLINHCESQGDWLELQLTGTDSSRDAVGAVVRVKCGDRQWVAPLTSGSGYLCSNERVLRFGLGSCRDALEAEVHWPNGGVQHISGLKAGQRWLIIQKLDELVFLPR